MIFFKSMNIWQSYKQERDCLQHFLRLSSVLARRTMACFADINVSQGSVATYAKCDGIFNIHITANLPRNLPVNFF